MNRIICLLSGHRFTPWRLQAVTHRNRVVTDRAVRSCSCCRRQFADKIKSAALI